MKSLIRKIRYDSNYKDIKKSINTLMCLGGLGLTQVLKGTIVAAFPSYLPIFFGVQFFGASIQGSLSDLYKRSIVLNVALSIVIIATLFLVVTHETSSYLNASIQLICIIFIGLGGNADVVSRAGIIDIHYHIDRRKILSWTVFSEAFSWVVIGLLIRYLGFNPFSILVLCLVVAIILLLISLLFNADSTQDKKHLQNTLNEIKLLIKSHIKKFILLTSIIIMGELGYFYFFYSQETHINDVAILADSYLSWFLGMSFGCWLLSKFIKPKDFVFLMVGIVISLISTVLFMAGGMKDINNSEMFYFDSIVYLIAGFGSGIYLPCFYSMISRGHSIHFQGLLNGWVDSLRVFGDAFSNFTLLGIVLISNAAPIFISFFLFVSSVVLLSVNKKRV